MSGEVLQHALIDILAVCDVGNLFPKVYEIACCRYDSDREGGFMSEPESTSRSRLRQQQQQRLQQQHQQQHLQHQQQQQQMAPYRDIGRPSTGNNHIYKNTGGGGGNRNQLYLDFNDR